MNFPLPPLRKKKRLLFFNFLLLLVCQAVLYWNSTRLISIAGTAQILDLQIYYFPSRAYSLLEALGAAGREFYLKNIWIDFIYPLAYSLFLWQLLRMIQTVPGQLVQKGIRFLPFLLAGLDYAENVCIIFLLITFPQISTHTALLAGYFTFSKWLLAAGILIYLIIIAVRSAVRKLRI